MRPIKNITDVCPCKVGDVLYRIADNCGGCEHETEVCQQRTCAWYKKHVEPMVVKSITARHSGAGYLYYVSGSRPEEDALYGWTAFPSKQEAERYLESFN